MRKRFFWLGTVIFSFSVSICSAYIMPGISGTWDFGPGYRTDHVQWSIANPLPSGTPNVLTEVDWRQLQTATANVRGHLTAWDHVYAKVGADIGVIMQGENDTTTYAGNDKTLPLSRFHSTSNNGKTADLTGGIGVNLAPWRSGVEIAPLIGYSFHQQNLRMENAIETFNANPALIGPIQGLKTSYIGRWDGPWVGIDFSFTPMCRVRVETGFEYHWLRYRARGLWSVSTCLSPLDFLNNYRQDANGTGQTFFMGASYELSPGWAFGFYANVENFRTHRGVHRSVFCTESGSKPTCCGPRIISLQSTNTLPLGLPNTVGTLPITLNTNLNPVHWHSFSFYFQFEARF